MVPDLLMKTLGQNDLLPLALKKFLESETCDYVHAEVGAFRFEAAVFIQIRLIEK